MEHCTLPNSLMKSVMINCFEQGLSLSDAFCAKKDFSVIRTLKSCLLTDAFDAFVQNYRLHHDSPLFVPVEFSLMDFAGLLQKQFPGICLEGMQSKESIPFFMVYGIAIKSDCKFDKQDWTDAEVFRRSTILSFIDQACEVLNGAECNANALYQAFSSYCKTYGHSEYTAQAFSRKLKSVRPEIQKQGEKYIGIALNPS